jgi:hypothetical protein
MRIQGSALVSLVFGCFLSSGCLCHDEEEAPQSTPPGVTRCLSGLQRAVQAPTLADTTSIYYDECADLFSQAACKDAWHAAAKLPDVDGRLEAVAGPCRKAYCASFSAFGFGICKDDYVISRDSLVHDWPPFFDAVVARESGAAAADLAPAFLGFIAHVGQLTEKTAAPAASAAASVAPAPAAPAPSASVSAAPPSAGSAAPPPSASAVAPPAPKPGAVPKPAASGQKP